MPPKKDNKKDAGKGSKGGKPDKAGGKADKDGKLKMVPKNTK